MTSRGCFEFSTKRRAILPVSPGAKANAGGNVEDEEAPFDAEVPAAAEVERDEARLDAGGGSGAGGADALAFCCKCCPRPDFLLGALERRMFARAVARAREPFTKDATIRPAHTGRRGRDG